MSGRPSPRRLWWLMVVFVGCYYSLFAFFPGLLLFVGVNHFGVWFLDTYAILATNDAISAGLDPYGLNPLDPFGRSHVYPHWWLHLRDLGLTRADNFALGASFVLLFFVAAIARLRPRAPGELAWYLAIFCASPLLLAVNRANNDLLVFALLAPVVPCLLSSHWTLRFVPIGLIAMAAGLKFYPAIAVLLLIAGGEPREGRLRLAAGVLVLVLVGLNVAPDLKRIALLLPKAEGLMTFGAANAFEAAGLTTRVANLAAFAVGAFAVTAFARAKLFSGWTIRPEDRNDWWSFVLGAALLTGCFFAGTNYAYRWVFGLWLAPLLWRLRHDAGAPAAVRRLAGVTSGLLIVTLWADPAAGLVLASLAGHVPGETIGRVADRFFVIEQPLVWAFFICLLGFLTHFAGAGVTAWWRGSHFETKSGCRPNSDRSQNAA